MKKLVLRIEGPERERATLAQLIRESLQLYGIEVKVSEQLPEATFSEKCIARAGIAAEIRSKKLELELLP